MATLAGRSHALTSSNPPLDAFARDVVSALSSHINPERAKVAEWYFPSAMIVLGVAVPDIRRVLREPKKSLKAASSADVIAHAQALVDTGVMEARQVAHELIETHPTALGEITRAEIERLGIGIDNWASTDSFATSVSGRAWRLGRLTDATIRKWARSKDRWWRRAAVVSTVPLNLASRGGKGDPERTIMICQLVATDADEMVAKGLSWALRSLIEAGRDDVESFLEEHGDALPARVRREVTTKLTTGRKNA